MDPTDRNKPTINTEFKSVKKFTTKKQMELKTEAVVHEKRRRFSESYSNFRQSERLFTELKISTIEPETPRTKKTRDKHSSSPDSLKGSDQIGKTLNSLEAIARITERIKSKQAIHYEGNQIFSIINNKESKVEKRKECLDEIVKILQVAAENGVVEVKGTIANITLSQIVTYLERAKWSSSMLDAEALKKTIHESELKLQETIYIHHLETKKASVELVQMLFPKELEPAELDKSLTLDDLHQIFTVITTPLNLFERILGALKDNKNQKQVSKLIGFCQKCIENKIGMEFYPDETLFGVLEKISTYIREDNSKILIKAYNERVIDAEKKTLEVRALDTPEIEMLSTWFNNIQNGNWSDEDVSEYARSIIKKVADAIGYIPLDEWITGNLIKRASTPKYHQMNDLLVKVSLLVAQDILESSKLKQRVNVMSFYGAMVKKCLSLGAFGPAWAIKSGFDLFPVLRLKATFKELPKKSSKDLIEFTELFSYDKNYSNLRSEIEKSGRTMCIRPPFLFGRIIAGLEGILEEENDVFIQNKLCILARSVVAPLRAMQESLVLAKNLETKSFLDRRIETYPLKSMEVLEEMSKELEL